MTVTIIAEVGLTHDGSLGNALRMVEVFAEAGADAVKFQDHLFQDVPQSQEHPSPHVHEGRRWYYERTKLRTDEFMRIRKRCHELGVEYIVSPFSVKAVESQEDWSSPDRYKVASGEVTNLPLLRAIRDTGRPVLVSEGMGEVEDWGEDLGFDNVTQMLCVSLYPCPPEFALVDRERYLTEALPIDEGGLNMPWGLSDHSPPDSIAACLAAVTLGATVLERHVCLSRHQYGSDAWMSMLPEEFANLVGEVRRLETMLSSQKTKDELVASPEIQEMRRVYLEKYK